MYCLTRHRKILHSYLHSTGLCTVTTHTHPAIFRSDDCGLITHILFNNKYDNLAIETGHWCKWLLRLNTAVYFILSMADLNIEKCFQMEAFSCVVITAQRPFHVNSLVLCYKREQAACLHWIRFMVSKGL